MTIITSKIKTTTQQLMSKKWLCLSLAAATLTLGACADKEAPSAEVEPMGTVDDAQTPVEQQATGVASADTLNDPIANNSMTNDPMTNDPMTNDPMGSDAVANDDVTVATADDGMAIDDSEILDGSETEEHISTY